MARKPVSFEHKYSCAIALACLVSCLATYNILEYFHARSTVVDTVVEKVSHEMEAAWSRRYRLAHPPETPLQRLITNAAMPLMTRVCGQPAIDGYAHVNSTCLQVSPTAVWHKAYLEAGGSNQDLVAHIERSADYDGLAVAWGINNKKATVEDCAQACRDHKPNPRGHGPFDALPCNAFVWCGAEVCFEPDAHHHTLHDCWLKFTEAPAFPELDMRGHFPDWYRKKHPNAPPEVQWSAGVLLPPGVPLTNGTWSVRWHW